MSDKLEALKAKKPLDAKTREAEAAGYVTDDNSGGYYVVECQECGEVYPSQQCDGGGPIADTGDYNDALCPHCGCESPDECSDTPLVWNVQQAKINALLAALEEKDQQAETLKTELLAIDKDHALEQKDDAESRARQLNRAGQRVEKLQQLLRDAMAAEQSALRREGHLKATVDVLSAKNAELERANAAQDDHINQQQDRIDTLEKKNGELGKHVGKLEQRLQQPIKLRARVFEMMNVGGGHSIQVVSVKTVKEIIRAAGFKVEVEGE